MTAFLGNSADIDFVVTTASCDTGSFVPSSTTTFNFTGAGTYRLCVKDGGVVSDVFSVTVIIQACTEVCSTTKSTGVCDVQTGKCTQCLARFSGDRCQTCVVGYSGASCDLCDTTKMYHCSSVPLSGSVSGFCAQGSSCTQCTCNGHYDQGAADRCPNNKCICEVGYTGAACQDCDADYYQMVNNITNTFSCNQCADKCNKRATSCTSSVCQCTGNFAVPSWEFSLPGFVYNVTADTCQQTESPSMSPTTLAPSVSPSVAVDPCANKTDDYVGDQGKCVL